METATMLRLVVHVKVTSPWMAGPKVSLQNSTYSITLPPAAFLVPIAPSCLQMFLKVSDAHLASQQRDIKENINNTNPCRLGTPHMSCNFGGALLQSSGHHKLSQSPMFSQFSVFNTLNLRTKCSLAPL